MTILDKNAVFLVGGAVRDLLMGIQPKDFDYVVVGSTPEQMIANGYTQVGSDFPVFLDALGNEFALARTESKTGEGYLGFTCDFNPTVSLETDLSRRDLTINSMAVPETKGPVDTLSVLIDPFGGLSDIQNKILRHTSDAFLEDPVRVLRVARFRARFGADWKVAPETKTLIWKMAKTGVLNELTAERVWKELSRALMEPYPRLFFDTLLECDALHVLFPEVYALCSAMESYHWHPEGNSFSHTMLVLTQAAMFDADLEGRMAALTHDFGKGLTKKEHMPKHYGHDVNGVPVVEKFCDRLKVPTKMKTRLMHVCRFHMNMHKLDELTPKTFVKMFMELNAWNDPTVIDLLYALGVFDERGRLGSENNPIDKLLKLYDVWDAVFNVKFADVFPNGETNVNKIRDGLFKARMGAVK